MPVKRIVFRGATKVTLDAKGRLAIPTRYRERIATRCDGQLVATVDKDYCLLIYPFPDWEEIERKLVRLPSLNRQARRLQRLMVGYATELELDANGRILLPRELRELLGMDPGRSVDDTDYRSKRAFSVIMLLFTLGDSSPDRATPGRARGTDRICTPASI